MSQRLSLLSFSIKPLPGPGLEIHCSMDGSAFAKFLVFEGDSRRGVVGNVNYSGSWSGVKPVLDAIESAIMGPDGRVVLGGDGVKRLASVFARHQLSELSASLAGILSYDDVLALLNESFVVTPVMDG